MKWLMVMFGSFCCSIALMGMAAAFAQPSPGSAATQPVEVTTRPAGKAGRPTGHIDPKSCVTAECHAKIKSFRVLHGPINADSCDPCHTPQDETLHTFKLTREKQKLCTYCHEIKLPATGVVHKPFQDQSCLECHDPHGGKNAQFMRLDSMRQVCATCHKDVIGSKSFVHGPVAADACSSCHQSHVAPFKGLLVSKGRDLCLRCHSDMGKQLQQASVVHKPASEDCLKCHDVHASDFAMHIKKEPAQLCLECHEPVKKQVDSSHGHSVVVKDAACLNCHTSHGGPRSKLLKSDSMTLCMKCHDKPIKLTDRTVASMKAVTDPNKVKHGPIRDGNCSGCHAVHGSEIGALLNKAYPETFYQSFAIEKYELCFSCHDKQLVETETAKGLTGFRNGTANLHYLHVNKSERGRNCRACHSTHASTNPMHVAEKVPFGNWEMPISYRKTDTGGSCSPGCHKPFAYDREAPVVYETETKP